MSLCLFCISSFILLSAQSKHFPAFLFQPLRSNCPSFFSLLWHFSKLPLRAQTISCLWPAILLLTAAAVCPIASFFSFYPSSPRDSTWTASSISVFFILPPTPLHYAYSFFCPPAVFLILPKFSHIWQPLLATAAKMIFTLFSTPNLPGFSVA